MSHENKEVVYLKYWKVVLAISLVLTLLTASVWANRSLETDLMSVTGRVIYNELEGGFYSVDGWMLMGETPEEFAQYLGEMVKVTGEVFDGFSIQMVPGLVVSEIQEIQGEMRSRARQGQGCCCNCEVREETEPGLAVVIKEIESGEEPKVLVEGEPMANGEPYLAWLYITPETEFRGGELADLQVGQEIEVGVPGPMLMSYPARGTATWIQMK